MFNLLNIKGENFVMIKVEIEGRVKVFDYIKGVSLVGKVEEAKKRIIFKTNKTERQKKCFFPL